VRQRHAPSLLVFVIIVIIIVIITWSLVPAGMSIWMIELSLLS
jgi:hypothetical protein